MNGERRVWGAAAALMILMTVLSGCGVPESGPPIVAGTPGPAAGKEQSESLVPLPRPEDARDSAEAVKLYFQAASSEWSGLTRQVGQFLTQSARSALERPVTRISVVRVTDWGAPKIKARNLHEIKVKGTVIGGLSESGVLYPEHRSFQHTFQMRYHSGPDGPVWLVGNPPPGFVLSQEALTSRFDALPVYFVNQHSSASLVPDVRYLPRAIEWSKQRNLLVEWLLQGPAPWLHGVALAGFPEGTKRRGNVYTDSAGRIVVELSSEAEGYERTELMFAQLVWTLRARMDGRLELRIDGRTVTYEDRRSQHRDRFLNYNAIAARDPGISYLVSAKGRVEAVPTRTGQRRLPAVIDDAQAKGENLNTAVDSAALTSNGERAALVRWRGEKQSLWVGRRVNRRVAYAPVTGLPSTETMSEPVWVGGSEPRSLLVAADGDLYGVNLTTMRARKVELPAGIGDIRAVSIAPDGYRMALIVDGRVRLAALSQLKGLRVEDTVPVTERLTRAVDVAWSREERLVVAGVGPAGGGLWEVSIDGVQLARVDTPANDMPDAVAGYPEVVMEVGRRGKVLVEQDGRVYEIFSSRFGNPGNAPSPPLGGRPFFSI